MMMGKLFLGNRKKILLKRKNCLDLEIHSFKMNMADHLMEEIIRNITYLKASIFG